MTAVAFESTITDNVIEIPEEYRGRIKPRVLVTITDFDFRPMTPHNTYPRTGTGPKTLSAPHIDTSGWKFDRDEANER
jgi:hypothetical protein